MILSAEILTDRSERSYVEKEKILKKIHPLIVSSINKYAEGKDEFEDLYQEGVVKVLELLNEFDEDKGVNMFYYLKLYLKFFYLNYARYDKKTISLNAPINDGLDGLELGDLIMDQQPGVEETVLEGLTMENVYEALKDLTKDDRYIIVELFIKNRTLDDLAKELSISRTSFFRKKEAILGHLRRNIVGKTK